MKRVFPSITKYDVAVKSLNKSVLSPEFKGGNPIYGSSSKIPKLIKYSGGYSVVYPIKIGNQKKALRCWLQEPGHVSERFERVISHFSNNPLSYFVDFGYSEKGILVDSQVFPVCHMAWIEGRTLSQFLDEEINNSKLIRRVASKFLEMVTDLHKNEIAHGDLQDGNIIVCSNSNGLVDLKLVDYDRVYTPNQKNPKSMDDLQGVSDYQPPRHLKRVNNEKADYFSELVIYLSLLAYAEDPSLWSEGQEKRLLFTSDDFENPSNSEAFQNTQGMSDEIKRLSSQLKKFCNVSDYNQIQPLEKIIANQKPINEIDDYFTNQKRKIPTKTKIISKPTSSQKPVKINTFFSPKTGNANNQGSINTPISLPRNTSPQNQGAVILVIILIVIGIIFALASAQSQQNEYARQTAVASYATATLYARRTQTAISVKATATARANILYSEDFSYAPEWEWSDDVVGWSINNNTLIGNIESGWVGWNYYDKYFKNVRIDTDVWNMSGSEVNEMGIICNRTDEGFYGFLIGSNQYYRIIKYNDSSDEFVDLTDWNYSSNISLNKNHITVACNNGNLTLTVNNIYLVEAYDDEYIGGDVGVILYTLDDTAFEVAFDNLSVSNP